MNPKFPPASGVISRARFSVVAAALLTVACFDPAARNITDTDPGGTTNAPPAGLAIAIDPAAPLDDDPLSCIVVTEAIDPAGEVVTYRFSWLVDGQNAGNPTTTVAASLTAVGETWACNVTPSDGTLDGAAATASVTVAESDADGDGDGYAPSEGDCDDGDPQANPGEMEDCTSEADDDCDGINNNQDALNCEVFYADTDGDSCGDPVVGRCRCYPAAGEADDNSDQDDTDPAICDGPITYIASNAAEMVAIPAGTFTMGGGAADAEDEYVDHQVTLTHAFWVGKSEVTRDEWEQNPDNVGWTYYSTDCVFGDCPADSLDWYDAVLYANWLSGAEGFAKCYLSDGSDLAPEYVSDPYDCPGYRLLTEAEWEYAARAGVDTTYSGSNTAGDVAWYYDNSEAYGYTSQRTCTLAPNAWGLCDMSGNEWEWVGDWYSDTFGGYGDGAASVDPSGPASAGARRYRGGSWDDAPVTLRLVTRAGAEPYRVYGGVDLRLARSYIDPSVDSDGDGYTGTGGDCDDGDAAINPGEVEDCSTEADDNCNGISNDQDAPGCTEFYGDGDGDGYGDPAIARCRCPPPAAGEVTNNSDRDDSDPGYH